MQFAVCQLAVQIRY